MLLHSNRREPPNTGSQPTLTHTRRQLLFRYNPAQDAGGECVLCSGPYGPCTNISTLQLHAGGLNAQTSSISNVSRPAYETYETIFQLLFQANALEQGQAALARAVPHLLVQGLTWHPWVHQETMKIPLSTL